MDTTQATHAAYFNLARHNLWMALNTIARKAGLSQSDNDEQIAQHTVLTQLKQWTTLDTTSRLSDEAIRQLKQVTRGLQQALPCLADVYMQGITGQKMHQEFDPTTHRTMPRSHSNSPNIRTGRTEDLHWVLTLLVKALMAQRNFHSHAHQDPVGVNAELANLLKQWQASSWRHALRQVAVDFELVKPRPVSTVQPRRLTEVGTAMLCCLFLDKQQGHEYLMQLPAIRDSDPLERSLQLRCLTGLNIRLPFERIETQNTPQTLALDILNELSRCPVEIYEHLSPSEQAHFETSSEADEESWSEEAHEGRTSRHIRHRDRFAPLVLDGLDMLSQADPRHDTGIDFALDLGDFYFAAYDKKLPDGSTEVRRLGQKVLRFGRLSQALQEANRSKPAEWRALERTLTERDHAQPYIVATHPHYHLTQPGSLAVRLRDAHSPSGLYPSPQTNVDQPERYRPLPGQKPHHWLSHRELVNLAFYQLLRIEHSLPEQTFPSIKNLLRAYSASHKRLYEDMRTRPAHWQCAQRSDLAHKLKAFVRQESAPFYELQVQDLPHDLQALLLGSAKSPPQRMQQEALNTLHLLLADGERRLQQIQRVKQGLKNQGSKPGMARHRYLRAGEMATFVAKDLLRMQPPQDLTSAHQGKPTSLMADLLQARLAFFGRDKASLPSLLTSLGLTGNNDPQKNHPFVGKLAPNAPGMNGIAQYYEAYLLERQTYLAETHKKLQTHPDLLQTPACAWLGLASVPERLQGRDQLDSLLGRYLGALERREPLNLPRGLFRALTFRALKHLNHAGMNAELEAMAQEEMQRQRPTSLSHLIEHYMCHFHGDGPQDFYFLDRPQLQKRFELLEGDDWINTPWVETERERLRAQNPRISAAKLNDALVQERQRRLHKLRQMSMDQNRQINQRMTQDVVLFLLARKLMDLPTQQSSRPNGFAPQDCASSPLMQIKLNSLKRSDLSAPVSHGIQLEGKTVFADAIKAKNLFQFKRLGRDRRLPGILHHYDASHVHLSLVHHELQAYARAQHESFTHMLAFERDENQRSKIQADNLPRGQSLHSVLLKQRLSRNQVPPGEREKLQAELLSLRNAFGHNQTPSPLTCPQPLAQPMLQQARDELSKQRSQANSLTDAASPSVAQHHAQALAGRYTSLQPHTDENSHG